MSSVINDPIADMLTRIRNAIMARHSSVVVPGSRLTVALAKIFRDEGFISEYEVLKGNTQKTVKINLKYEEKKQPVIYGLKRVSKPGLRIYIKRENIRRVRGGLGIAVISTSKGIMTGKEAFKRNLGGELLCYVW